jgi:hypothetical protein
LRVVQRLVPKRSAPLALVEKGGTVLGYGNLVKTVERRVVASSASVTEAVDHLLNLPSSLSISHRFSPLAPGTPAPQIPILCEPT